MSKQIVALFLFMQVVFSTPTVFSGVNEPRHSSEAFFIPAAQAAYAAYAILTGVTVAGIYYYAAEKAPKLPGVNIRYPNVANTSKSLEAFATRTDRDFAIKAKLSEIVFEYRNVKEEIENAYAQNEMAAVVSVDSLRALHGKVIQFRDAYSEVGFVLQAKSIDDAEDLNGSELFAGTEFADYKYFSPQFDPRCDPEKIVKNYRSKGYKVVNDKQSMDINDAAHANESVNRMLHVMQGGSVPGGLGEQRQVLHFYKNGKRMCELYIDDKYSYFEVRSAFHKNTIEMYEKVLDRDPDVTILRAKMPDDCGVLTDKNMDLCQTALELFFKQ